MYSSPKTFGERRSGQKGPFMDGNLLTFLFDRCANAVLTGLQNASFLI